MRTKAAQAWKVRTYGSNDTRAVGADQAGLVLGLEDVGNADHVWQSSISVCFMRWRLNYLYLHTVLGNTLSNAIPREKRVSWKQFTEPLDERLTKQREGPRRQWPPQYQRQPEGDCVVLAIFSSDVLAR